MSLISKFPTLITADSGISMYTNSYLPNVSAILNNFGVISVNGGEIQITNTGVLKTDAIYEYDSGDGVTIDGVLLKDNGVTASGASVFSTSISTPSITTTGSSISFNSKNFTAVGTIGSDTITTTGSFSKTIALAADVFLSGRQTADSFARFNVVGNGNILMGGGSTALNSRIGWSTPGGFFVDDNGGGNGGRVSMSGGIIEAAYNISTNETLYNTGTVSQSGTTITGSGTTFTSAMVGATIRFNSGEHAFIKQFTSTTSLEADVSQTVSSTTYSIVYGGCSFSKVSGYINNLYFPTSGGTPSALNFYEIGTHSTTWSGIWAAAQSGSIQYQRLGKCVTLRIPLRSAAANTAALIVNDTVLPSYLRPASFYASPQQVLNNSASANGLITVNSSTGGIQICATVGGGNFTASGNGGLSNDIAISYLTS